MLFGVATDVCNDAAVRGLLARNRRVTFVEDASRGLDEARTASCTAAWREAGVRFATAAEVAAASEMQHFRGAKALPMSLPMPLAWASTSGTPCPISR